MWNVNPWELYQRLEDTQFREGGKLKENGNTCWKKTGIHRSDLWSTWDFAVGSCLQYLAWKHNTPLLYVVLKGTIPCDGDKNQGWPKKHAFLYVCTPHLVLVAMSARNSSTPQTDHRFLLGLDLQSRSFMIYCSSCCRVGPVPSAWSSSWFLGWICVMQMLHNLSQRQVRNYLDDLDHDVSEVNSSKQCVTEIY